MTKSKEVRFITSILHWLSEFPNTPISSLSSPKDLADPNTLYQTLTVLLYQEDLRLDSRMSSIFRYLVKFTHPIGELSCLSK